MTKKEKDSLFDTVTINILKAIAVIIIASIGAWVTFGGNIVIGGFLYENHPNLFSFSGLCVFWAIEIILILIFAIKYIFGTQKKRK